MLTIARLEELERAAAGALDTTRGGRADTVLSIRADELLALCEAARSVYLEAIAPYYARLLATLRVFGEVSLVEEVPHGDESTED